VDFARLGVHLIEPPMPTRSLVQKVRDYLHRQKLAPAGLVVAVSGGPDSVALLLACLEICKQDEGRLAEPLVVAHLNHRLRGPESDADEAFVRDLHARLRESLPGLQLRVEAADVAARARLEGANLEATARQTRYDWLVRVACEAGVSRIATGHTADDQAETVLHRLLRGTGLRGLTGIAARRRLDPLDAALARGVEANDRLGGIELIRPLLPVSRAEVLAYLQERGQPYCQDRSNLDRAYTRNRIRHELLPELAARYNPAVVSVLARLAEQAAEAYQDIEDLARKLLDEVELPPAGMLRVFDRQGMLGVSSNLAREMLRLVWLREAWPMGALGFEEWECCLSVFRAEIVAADLPGGIRACLRDRVVVIGPENKISIP
jgi:tRNA(Ile)-lysidine synthase